MLLDALLIIEKNGHENCLISLASSSSKFDLTPSCKPSLVLSLGICFFDLLWPEPVFCHWLNSVRPSSPPLSPTGHQPGMYRRFMFIGKTQMLRLFGKGRTRQYLVCFYSNCRSVHSLPLMQGTPPVYAFYNEVLDLHGHLGSTSRTE